MSFLPSLRFKPKASTQEMERASSDKRSLHAESKSYPPPSDLPLCANFCSSNLTVGSGVAIFHLATARVVLCYHSKEHYHFLPKGRKDVNEATTRGAEREGYEESGFRNRLLPVPIPHRQPQPHNTGTSVPQPFVSEAIWAQLAPVSRSAQYMLFWYAAETIPPSIEAELNARASETGGLYEAPPPFEHDLTIAQRIDMEPNDYQPVRHENTGVDEDELLYQSSLVPIDEAIDKLGEGSISADVVRQGWQAIQKRRQIEESADSGKPLT